MGRKVKNIHYIYKTTCNVTGRWYIGMHSTNNMEDGYMGSGKRLRYSIRKYGKHNHTKEILEFCETREALANREREIVTNELINENLCMNLNTGGEGGRGFTEEEMRKGVKAAQEKLAELRKNPEWESRRLERISKTVKYQYDNGIREKGEFCNWSGKNHSEETKKLMSENKKNNYLGKASSQYGTCWINKDNLNKKIKKEDLNNYLTEGWVKGRIFSRW